MTCGGQLNDEMAMITQTRIQAQLAFFVKNLWHLVKIID
jgi:hypothetical protein